MNPLTTVKWPLILGFIAAIVIAIGVDGGFHFDLMNMAALTRWLHIIAGVFWIGLLYYFNAVQTPAMAAAAADKGGPGGAGVNKYVAPLALKWFRWAAVATWLTGAWYLSYAHQFVNALTLGHGFQDRYGLVIGLGMWLGTIMLFNVWVLIWPNQQKILGLTAASDAEKAQARKTALLASRINFALSIPLVLCMGSATHGLPL